MSHPKSQIIHAPSHDTPLGHKSIFLAGTTSKVDTTNTTSSSSSSSSSWRETLCSLLSAAPVTIYNPYRADWDSTWREDVSFAPYREQVEWELAKQEAADVVVVYFHPATRAPVSLLELGLCARTPGKAIVCCPKGYWKRGNVQLVCRRFGVEMVGSVEELGEAVLRKLGVDA